MKSGSAWVLKDAFHDEAQKVLDSLSAPAGQCLICAGVHVCLLQGGCVYVVSHAALMHHACIMLRGKTIAVSFASCHALACDDVLCIAWARFVWLMQSRFVCPCVQHIDVLE